MSGGSDQWSTTKTIATVKDAVEQALDRTQEQSIASAKLPLKAVVGLCIFLLTQALALAGIYYDARADIRSLQEAQSDLESLAAASDLDAVRVRVDSVHSMVTELESDMRQPPTNLDHLRVIGEIKADMRLIEQRVKWLEDRL